ncbi:2993_t:CDS:2, partial [Cetraspora pellucida]
GSNFAEIKKQLLIDEDEYDVKDITIEIDNVRVLVKLDKSLILDSVRQILESYDAIKIIDSIYFTKNGVLIDIKHEQQYKLRDILDKNKNKIFLMKDPRPNWQEFIVKFSVLEPYKLKSYNLKTSSIGDLTRNKNLFLKAQLDIPHIANLGLSIEPKNIQQHNSEET